MRFIRHFCIIGAMVDKIDFKTGDTVKVSQKIDEGKRERTVSFEGMVVKLRGTGKDSMVSVRQLVEGVLVDRIIPLSMPNLVSVKVISSSKKVRGNLPRNADYNTLVKRLY